MNVGIIVAGIVGATHPEWSDTWGDWAGAFAGLVAIVLFIAILWLSWKEYRDSW